MFITTLIQIGKVYQFLTENRQNPTARITVKNGKEVVFDNIVVDNIIKTNTVYRYLLEHWDNGKVQIFYKDIALP